MGRVWGIPRVPGWVDSSVVRAAGGLGVVDVVCHVLANSLRSADRYTGTSMRAWTDRAPGVAYRT